jgi:hypothetical protein
LFFCYFVQEKWRNLFKRVKLIISKMVPLKGMDDKAMAEPELMNKSFPLVLYATFSRTPGLFSIREPHLPRELETLEDEVAAAFRKAAGERDIRLYRNPDAVYNGTKPSTRRGVAFTDAKGELLAKASSWTRLKHPEGRRFNLMARFEFGMRSLDDYDGALRPALVELWHLFYPVERVGGNDSSHFTTIFCPADSSVLRTDQAVLDHVAPGLRLPAPY